MENPFEWIDKYNTILIILGGLLLPVIIMWRLGGFEKEKPAQKPRKTVYHSAVSATLQAKKKKEAEENG